MLRTINNRLIAISLLISVNFAHAVTSDLESQSEDTSSIEENLDSLPKRKYAKKIVCASLSLVGLAGVGIGAYVAYERFNKDLEKQDSTGLSNPMTSFSPSLSPTILRTHAPTQSEENVCPLLSPYNITHGESSDFLNYELDEVWFESEAIPSSNHYLEFRDWVEEQVEPEPFSLLKRQREVFAGVYGDDSSVAMRFDLIISEQAGSIRNISCLEANLFNKHLAFGDASESRRKGEFSAWMFKKNQRLKVIQAIAHIPKMSGPRLEDQDKWFKQMENRGWLLFAFLHSHPFSFDNHYGDISGTTIPSSPDLLLFNKLFLESPLEKALITNGFSTIEVSQNDTIKLMHTLKL